MASCHKCKREIHNGTEAQKMVTLYTLKTGEVLVSNPSVGEHLSAQQAKAKGQVRKVQVAHFKCHMVGEKVKRRTADDGSLVGNMPTAYEISAMTMNRDEAEDAGLTVEEAMANNTAELSTRAVHVLDLHLKRAKSLGVKLVGVVDRAVKEMVDAGADPEKARAAAEAVLIQADDEAADPVAVSPTMTWDTNTEAVVWSTFADPGTDYAVEQGSISIQFNADGTANVALDEDAPLPFPDDPADSDVEGEDSVSAKQWPAGGQIDVEI